MNGQLLIKAAMRSADMGHLAEQMERLEQGGIDAFHFDVMDGRFVPEICGGPLCIRGLRKYSGRPFEVHLLVSEPDACAEQYVEAGANCVFVHIETCADPATVLARLRARDCQAGLAIAPATPSSALAPYLHLCDAVNVMTVAPGHPGALQEGGVRHLEEVAGMVRRGGGTSLVQADGAVSSTTRDRLVGAGAQALVTGYPIFSQESFERAIAQLRHGYTTSAVLAPSVDSGNIEKRL